MIKHPKFQTYQDDAGEWRWRLVAANGRIVADSSEGYIAKWEVERALRTVRKVIASLPPTT